MNDTAADRQESPVPRRGWEPARPAFRRRGLTFGGAVGALVLVWLSLTPSLLPRGPLFQGIVTGAAAVFGYGLGVGLGCRCSIHRSSAAKATPRPYPNTAAAPVTIPWNSGPLGSNDGVSDNHTSTNAPTAPPKVSPRRRNAGFAGSQPRCATGLSWWRSAAVSRDGGSSVVRCRSCPRVEFICSPVIRPTIHRHTHSLPNRSRATAVR